MKKLLLYTVFIFSLVCGYAQTNLVPNPSFEDTTSCPLFSNIAYAVGWENYWGSPDYYNTCSNSNSFGIPYNWVGQQSAHSGNGYTGLYTFYIGANQREVIGTQLIQNLIIGTKYYVSGYISRADSADTAPFTCSSNNFGFKFSTIPFLWSSGNNAPINNFAHVYSNSIISNKTGWTKISGSFIADSTYQYIMVGNFFDNLNTDTINCNYSLALAYYYVDDICVSTDSLTCNFYNSIQNLEGKKSFAIYPNPTSGNITLSQLIDSNPFEVFVYNQFGELLFNEKTKNSSLQLNLNFGETNLLILKILYKNQVYHYKILKL